jgi:predicted TIM-barrel fold metal-dependent hydrolase
MKSCGKSWSDEVNGKACEVPDVGVSENHREPQLPRRQFLSHVGGLTALAATALLCKGRAWAEAPPAPTGWIDIHSHYAPPNWVNFIAANQGRGMLGNTSFLSTFKGWTPARSIEQMDAAGIATSIVSLTTPGIWFGDSVASVDATRQLARQCNDYGAKMVADFPGRFGLFAALPLPDVDGSLREIEYALDTLKADGFGLLSHYSETYGEKLLGDPAFAPVFEELNRRKAAVYVHRKISAEPYEIFGWDVHRTILSLLKANAAIAGSGFSPLFPEIKFIFCDAGGTMPFLVRRSTAPTSPAGTAADSAHGLPKAVREFYYGTGRSNNAGTMSALKQIVPISHILFGTDYPFARVTDEARGLRKCGVFNAEELQAVSRNNALALLPQLKTQS